ncbi:MAG: hypothetical protein A2622_01665 [Bdellovibrionales bacterium RIFCSPHIGHO2_01_FULL_40_29]|nr:MAG: hypothetical protein A2622_01665 [Bdellovibrionales bacterium RIFCSPHIGHO2_01_FULL_40_29]OFZ33803.1 MAG: hypothetical protein A3D17_02085 [Bdellovibrionales bacterium RIFCSPHIGHO2_02_FULL_40_15]
MKSTDFNLEASARFVSSEVENIFETVAFLIPNWKWLALIGIFAGLYFFQMGIKWTLNRIKINQNYFKEKTFMQFFLRLEIEKSISWILTLILGTVLIESLELTLNLEKYLILFFKLILAFYFIRICYLAAEAFGDLLHQWAKNAKTVIDDQLAYFVSRTIKVFVVVIGCLIALQNFGINVTALLAGLGIGGIALAFAAQDTVANVFGTITILLDSPFKIGDRIKIGDTEGTVEELGFRSTRIRTFYNSLIIIPNSTVAKEKIDNFASRNGWVRFRHTIGLTYETTPELIQQFCDQLKSTLTQDPTIDRDRFAVTFNSFGDSTLNIVVNFHFHIDTPEEEFIRAQKYLQVIHHIVIQMKLDFAFPTRTMIIQNKPATT